MTIDVVFSSMVFSAARFLNQAELRSGTLERQRQAERRR